MAAGTLNLVIDAGTTYSDTVTVYNETGAVFNLTGYGAILQVRSTWIASGTLFATFGTATSGITIPTPANGQILIGPIDRTLLADLGTMTVDTLYVWGLNIFVAGAAEIGILRGTFRIRPTAVAVP